LERTGITPSNGERLFITSNSNNLSIVCWGFEEEIV
jgi:hypothetical protein